MSSDNFKSLLKLEDHNFIITKILPNLCMSSEFVNKYLKGNKDGTPKANKILKIIFEQLKSNEEERIIIGIKCLEALNNKHREFLYSGINSILKYLSVLVRSENGKIKEKWMDFLVSILSNWTGKEREFLGE